MAVEFEPPPVDGLEPEFGPVRWFGLSRKGTQDVTVSKGSDLVLSTDQSETPDRPSPGEEHWNVVVRSEERTLVGFRVHGRPPADIRIPAPYLDRPGVGNARVRLEARKRRSAVLDEDGKFIVESNYVVTPVARVELGWQVEIVP